eukprot:2776485-Lingulodinium_polyedra.AAC.1
MDPAHFSVLEGDFRVARTQDLDTACAGGRVVRGDAYLLGDLVPFGQHVAGYTGRSCSRVLP